jgi:hypothetical protein
MVSEMKNITPPQVCLILGLAIILAGSVVGLAALGKDVVTILTGVAAVAITVAGAFGWAKANQLSRDLSQVNDNVDHVKELSNGRLTEVLDQNRKLQERVTQLAILVQPGEDKK